jgi:hypothetical protein
MRPETSGRGGRELTDLSKEEEPHADERDGIQETERDAWTDETGITQRGTHLSHIAFLIAGHVVGFRVSFSPRPALRKHSRDTKRSVEWSSNSLEAIISAIR